MRNGLRTRTGSIKPPLFPDGNILDKDRISITFHGLDTYAEVYLNEVLVLKADNMFRTWEVDIKENLKPGKNELRVYFHSPIKEGMKKFTASPYLVPATNELAPMDQRTSVHTRKAPYHYGWDWGPRLVTSGVWRSVELVGWNAARIESAFLKPETLSTEKAEYTAHLSIESIDDYEGHVGIYMDNKQSDISYHNVSLEPGMNEVEIPVTFIEPKLWWPNGLGEQPLTDVNFQLKIMDEVVDEKAERIGIREVKLVQKPDEHGKSFHFEVNGIPVFMKGANYIPPHNLNPTVTTAQYEMVLDAALAANMNMLRVWGGAIYENDEFYRLCDEKGILIWQDFMFACAMYPATEDFFESVKHEAIDNIKRLRNHASLAMWCGNNENLTAWHKWNWQQTHNLSPEDSADLWHGYEKVFYDILPNAIKTYDPGKFFWPSSPASDINVLANHTSGDEHDWRIWFQQAPFKTYGENTARFVSEYGLQAYPDMKTIRAFANEDERDMDLRSDASPAA